MQFCALLLCLLAVALVESKVVKKQWDDDLERDYTPRRLSYADFLNERNAILKAEAKMSFQHDVELNAKEHLANDIIMRIKRKELSDGFNNPRSFIPSRHIFEVLDDIKRSDLFKIIQKMPKGGILHAHNTAISSANFIVNITYMPDLWQCQRKNEIVQFLFAKGKPTTAQKLNTNCEWRLVADERVRVGAAKYDAYVRTLFTLYDPRVNPRTQYADINAVWKKLQQAFTNVRPLVEYSKAWGSYFRNAIQEMYDDNVQYLEFRSSLHHVKK